MTMIAARRFALDVRPDLAPTVVDKMLFMLRGRMPGLMVKNDVGHWTFDEAGTQSVKEFLLNDDHAAAAEADSRSMAMYSSGRNRGRKEATIRLRLSTGEICDLSLVEAEKAFHDMSAEIHKLSVKVAQLEQAAAPQSTVIQFPSRQPAANIAAPAAPKSKKKGKTARQESISKMAYFIATNPVIAMTSRTKREAQMRYAEAANSIGLRTPSGIEWAWSTLNNHRKELDAKIKYVLKAIAEGRIEKPKVRLPSRAA